MLVRIRFGQNLKKYRKSARVSQEKLGNDIGMGQNSISKIENCYRNTSLDTVGKIANGLGISPYMLFMSDDDISAKKLLLQKEYRKVIIIMLYQYHLIVTRINSEEYGGMGIDTYGIGLTDCENLSIEDISTDKDFVDNLVNLCNRFQVDPIHLFDVVEDAVNASDQP